MIDENILSPTVITLCLQEYTKIHGDSSIFEYDLVTSLSEIFKPFQQMKPVPPPASPMPRPLPSGPDFTPASSGTSKRVAEIKEKTYFEFKGKDGTVHRLSRGDFEKKYFKIIKTLEQEEIIMVKDGKITFTKKGKEFFEQFNKDENNTFNKEISKLMGRINTVIKRSIKESVDGYIREDIKSHIKISLEQLNERFEDKFFNNLSNLEKQLLCALLEADRDSKKLKENAYTKSKIQHFSFIKGFDVKSVYDALRNMLEKGFVYNLFDAHKKEYARYKGRVAYLLTNIGRIQARHMCKFI
jgi:hypothetical protein